jgi:outer membrane protein assembly factor BamB
MRTPVVVILLTCATGVGALSLAAVKDSGQPTTGAPVTAVTAPTADSKLTSAIPKTSWPSFRNDDGQRGIATSSLPEKLNLLWKFPTQDGWVSSVAIVGNRVYAPSLTGYLYCLDVKTGREIWKYRSIEDSDPDKFAAGFKAAPRVTNDTVYVGDEDGFFHAVDRATGKKKWILTTDGEIAGSAAIVGDRIIVGSHDFHLYCLKPDGELVWKFETGDRINCSPAIAGDYTFVAGCDEHLRVIDIRKGEEFKDIPLNTYLIASPAVVGDELYVGTYASDVVAVNWKTGKTVWHYKDEKREFPYHASASATDSHIFVGGHDKQFHCINRKTGQREWVFPTRAQINSSAAVVGDRVFFGSGDGNIYGLNTADGKQVWKFNAGKDITAGIAVGEGYLVVGEEGSNGNLYCFGEKKQ